MGDAECITFLQWALPKLGLRWAGFRKPRRQVCRRIRRRFEELGLSGFEAYRRLLETEGPAAPEWHVLDSLCRVTISRFYRDWSLWRVLELELLPELAREAESAGRPTVRAWSVGCASGEEPYSLVLAWRFGRTTRTQTELEVLATDIDVRLLERAERALYPAGCLRELPDAIRQEAFRPSGDRGELELRKELRDGVVFRREDIRKTTSEGPFDLILCRNLAWTYFDATVGRRVLDRIAWALRPGGVVVIGGHEELPECGLEPIARSMFQKP